MAPFPILKTSAVAQYPGSRAVRFQNQHLRFLDGTEQRYRDYVQMLHRWEIRLDQLDEAEVAAVDAFFSANQGAFGNFAFTDPWDGTVYPNCSLLTDDLLVTAVAEMRAKIVVTIVENRG